MVKNIIKRIIVGVGVALALMYIKGGLVANVYALDQHNHSLTRITWSVNSTNTNKTISSATYWGIPFYGVTDTSAVGKITYVSNNDMVAGKKYDVSFFLIQANTGQDGNLPLVTLNNTPCTVIPFGTYKSYYQESNLEGFRFNDGGSGLQPIYPILDGVMGFDNIEQYPMSFTQSAGNLVFCQNIKSRNYDYVEVYTSQSSSSYNLAGLSFYGVSQYIFYEENEAQVLIDNSNQQTQTQNEINDKISDSSTDDPSSDITDMNDKIATNNSISQILTLPIQLYQNILNSVSGSCSSFSLGSLYNHNLTLPCINLQNLLGSTLYGIIDILISGLFILSFRKKMVDIFNHMTSLNDRGNELE